MRIRELCPDATSAAQLRSAVAEARGCQDEEAIRAFLEPLPPIEHALRRAEAYERARERIRAALGWGQRIVLFGDYDADGITSLVQMHRFLRAAGHPPGALRWFVPDRQRHDYGLTAKAVEECLSLHDPQLIIALDCGTSSPEVIRRLGERGVDCVVIDHHALESPPPAHPAHALVNPLAWETEEVGEGALRRASASGLTFLCCEQLAADLGVGDWDRNASLLLGALGTVVDVMPLIGVNRALVKHALAFAAEHGLAGLPGLAALHETTGGAAVDARTFGFLWGPRLNAPGRLEDAAHPVDLLLADDLASARPLAARCQESNRLRQELTRTIEEEALVAAEERLREHPEDTVLVLGAESWHPGIVGIVAGRLRERYARPAVVCGGHAKGTWKGSGRSLEGFDLGAAIRDACAEGILRRGGGHALAAGLELEAENLDALRRWLNTRSTLGPEDLVRCHEVLCSVDAPKLRDWTGAGGGDPRGDSGRLSRFWGDLLEPLEPFGAGNPKPGLLLRGGEIRWGPEPRKRKADGTTWAWAAGFTLAESPGLLFAEWTELERARMWRRGERYDLVVTPTRSTPGGRAADARTWYGWRVLDARPA